MNGIDALRTRSRIGHGIRTFQSQEIEAVNRGSFGPSENYSIDVSFTDAHSPSTNNIFALRREGDFTLCVERRSEPGEMGPGDGFTWTGEWSHTAEFDRLTLLAAWNVPDDVFANNDACDLLNPGIGPSPDASVELIGPPPVSMGCPGSVTATPDFSIDVAVDVTNDGAAAVDVPLELVIGNLDVGTQPETVPAGSTVTVRRTFNLVNTQIQQLPGDGRGTHDYQLRMGVPGATQTCEGTVTIPEPSPTEPAGVESAGITTTSPQPGVARFELTIAATAGTQNNVRVRPFLSEGDGFLDDFDVTIQGGQTTTVTREYQVPGGTWTMCAQVGTEQFCEQDVAVEPPADEQPVDGQPTDGGAGPGFDAGAAAVGLGVLAAIAYAISRGQ